MERIPFISIFTPTHRADYLEDILRRLQGQPYVNWEWIILPNSNVRIPELNDKRVRIIDDISFFDDLKIGAIKKKCCSLAKGDILLELDHDDYLSHDALSEIAKAFHEQDADFVYSDFSEFFADNGENHMYNHDSGWRYYDIIDQSTKDDIPVTRKAARAFPAEPPWILNITHAPNHVRCWKKSFYEKIGGHDQSLSVGDDYDIVVRTYLEGGKIVHIPKCLYFYRFFRNNNNTHKSRMAYITETCRNIYYARVWQIYLKHCADKGLKAIDLGSAHGKPTEPGWIGVDQYEGSGVDVKANLNEKWPFDDNSVGMIRCQDFVEHMEDQIHFFNESWRVLSHGGMILIEVPSTDGRGAFQDPTHITFMNTNTFWYYTQRSHKRYLPQFKGSFGAYKIKDWYPNKFCEDNKILYTQAHLIADKSRDPSYTGKEITPLPVPAP